MSKNEGSGQVGRIYAGKDETALMLYVDGGSRFRDGGYTDDSGLYEITAVDMRRLCDQLALEHPGSMTGARIADGFDTGNVKKEWIRASWAFAAWFKGKEPIAKTDIWIG